MPVGGIRKHIQTIINDNQTSSIDYYLIHSNLDEDVAFKRTKNKLYDSLKSYLKLKIKKNPSLYDIFALIKICIFIKRNKINLVHCHGAKAGILGRVAAVLTKAKSVYTPHGGSLHSNRMKLIESFYILIEKQMKSFTDFFIFESSYSYNQFVQKIGIPKNYTINYNGININDNFDKKTNNIINIGFIGELRKEKGPDIFIQTILDFNKENNPKIFGHMYGSGIEEKNLKNKINQNSNIKMYGNVSDVNSRLSNIDVLIVSSRFESLGYVILEAINHGVLVICSGVGGTSEIIIDGYNGFIVSENIASNYIHTIERLRKHTEDELDLIRNNAFTSIKAKFNEDLMKSNLNKVYKNLLKP